MSTCVTRHSRRATHQQDVDIAHGKDSLAVTDATFEPVVVDATCEGDELAFVERQLDVRLRHKVELGAGLAFGWLSNGDRACAVIRNNLRGVTNETVRRAFRPVDR